MKKEFIFLSTQEAIDAICIDFRQYAPQIILFSEIIGPVTGNRIHIKREPGKAGAWINRSGKTAMQWLEGPELVETMCRIIHQTAWNPKLLAAICGRVFQTRATPACDIYSRSTGICIETNMEAYVCRQCGRCCQTLDYHDGVTAEDLEQWKVQGRRDILQWVAETNGQGKLQGYRIWVVPETGRLAETCPFLKKDTTNRWQCQIHHVKPAICRQYPVSRKHAIMTGCRGFE